MDHAVERRRAFARALAAAAAPPGAGRERLEAAFRDVPRERFLGTGPWRGFHAGENEVRIADPAQLYQDLTVVLARERGINNGQPSLHALCLAASAVAPGEHVVHVGAGTGYYTAVLAHLAGPGGHIDAYEIEADLARRASELLAPLAQVVVHPGSGAEPPLPVCDIIYVSAGATSPLAVWINALTPGGRLLFPLTADSGAGAMLLVHRNQPSPPWPARFLVPVLFIPCNGARSPEESDRLQTAFDRGDWRKVQALHIGTAPDASSWCSGSGWWLSTRHLGSDERLANSELPYS